MPVSWKTLETYQITWNEIDQLGLTWDELDHLSEPAVLDLAKQRIDRFKATPDPLPSEKIVVVQQVCNITGEKTESFTKEAVKMFGLKLVEKVTETAYENRELILAGLIKLISKVFE